MERKAYAPGQHGPNAQARKSRGNSDYANQLREKQKARRIYGVLETQFRRYYALAVATKGLTGVIMLQLLESRLDNVIFRLGFAENRAHARNLVSHGHFLVNGRRSNVASMSLKPGDMIEVRKGSQVRTYFKSLPDLAEPRTTPSWLSRDPAKLTAKVLQLPSRQEIDAKLNEQLIVEYYSR
jgi:small subunit ribosomal protein S4